MQLIVGGVGNRTAEENWIWDLNPVMAAKPERGPCSLEGEEREPRDLDEEGRGPRSFEGVEGENHAALTEWGPHGSNTADGAGSLNHRLLLLFLRYSTPDWAEGEGRTVCICGYSRGL